ncbi:hypothetical protein ONS95_000636 [Cadophora gregata]|uniref:uncharacterized protein n=1 Tax=Cadophora gregata TaxID=51156 RepID=UPI0026DC2065|nr:uncharacterized protein ONS95_000636 [Cadophora gregata]KAK0125341.1 hypothetical protein ONS96_009190 [Cadophora gregata f. sp. sojae]KAK0128679.1 hypothetical protein ONS95_000636 [Cadophora gregata]
MSLQELMEQWQVMSDRRAEEDRARDRARIAEDEKFEATKQSKLSALVAELTTRIPSYESRSAGALRMLKREQANEFTQLQIKHTAQLKALQKKQEDEIAAFPEKYIRKAEDIENNLRADIQWELDLMLEVEQAVLENTLSVERKHLLEARDREDRLREQARALIDRDLNSQVLTTFRHEASRQNQHRQVTVAQLNSAERPLKSILKKPRGISVNSDGTTTLLYFEDGTREDRQSKRVKMEGSSRRTRAVDILDENATLFPYRENKSPANTTNATVTSVEFLAKLHKSQSLSAS